MPGLAERLEKLRGKSLRELRERGAQAALARLEQFGLSWDCREPSDRVFARVFDAQRIPKHRVNGDELLQRFRKVDLPLGRYLGGLARPAVTARCFRMRCPRGADAVIAAAEQVLSGRVDLGARTDVIGERPDWTLEPRSRKRAPAVHWSRIAYLDPEVAGDCKFTWELNRHQYFVTLAQAYLLTGEDRYAQRLTAHLWSWMDDNPPQIGINWTSSLELALRAISWIWALALARTAPSLTGEVYLRSLKFLYLQARHIERNLSTYFSPNTHLTGEALALLYISTAFPEFKVAHRWRSVGLRVLAEELERQVLPDGVYFEQSTYYHRYTADFYLHALLLAGADRAGDVFRSKLNALLEYLVHITRPDGTTPFIGDDDGGRLVVLGQRAGNDFRDTLAIGAAVLRRGDCAYVAGNSVEELTWLLGPDGAQKYDEIERAVPLSASRAFAASGYYVMRENWTSSADWALVRSGSAPHLIGAHAHADALAIEVSMGGRPVLIDAGTYVYTASRADRDYFRGGAAHNTITIDGKASAEPAASPFKWQSVPRPRESAWLSNAAFDFFEGEHDGFTRLSPPAVHSRAVFFLRGAYLVIRDRIRSAGKHHLALHWHWAPDVALVAQAGNVFTATVANTLLVTGRIFARTGELSCDTAWVSPAYGMRTLAPVCIYRLDADGTEETVTLLVSPSVRIRDSEWHASAQNEAGVLTIEMDSTRDTILTGPVLSDVDGHQQVMADAKWTWVRYSLDGEPLEFVLIHGSNLLLGKTPVFRADRTVDCAVGRRVGGVWEIALQDGEGALIPSSTQMADRVDGSCVASVE